MVTECNPEQLAFDSLGRREVVAKFDSGQISSDGGALLLREVEQRTGILERFSRCFTDYRDPERIEHTVGELVAQRVIGLALGYEDVNDHDELRLDQLLAVVIGKADPTGSNRLRAQDRGKPLAGKSTLNRLELTPADANEQSRYQKIVAQPEAMDALFVERFVESHRRAPARMVLDLDATDDP
nr:transposase [Gammaproteobacteria bacterium]